MRGREAGKEAPSLMNSLEHEHRHEKDSSLDFASSNGMTTKSVTEWEVVVEPRAELVDADAYPERSGLREHHREWCRRPVPLRELWGKAELTVNPRLERAGHSVLIEEELVAGRLYTGPMYQKVRHLVSTRPSLPAMSTGDTC